MKKIISDKVVTTVENQEILKKYTKDTLFKFLEEFCIFNVGDVDVTIALNDGNFFVLEAGEGFDCKAKICKCVVKEAGAVLKFSAVAD